MVRSFRLSTYSSFLRSVISEERFCFGKCPRLSIEKVITFYDARVVQGHDVGYSRPIGTTALFFVLCLLLSAFRKTRFIVLFFGAVKCVLFGLSSSYLLGSGAKMMAYSIWWFPFQFISCFLFLVYCAVLSPPFLYAYDNREKSQYASIADY